MMHGGDLAQARAHAGRADIVDLSTGINPHPYPATHVTQGALTALPQPGAMSALLSAARVAYGVPDDAAILAAPGTQAILQWLPHVVPARRVAIIGPTYGEHAATWSRRADVTTVPDLASAHGADLVVAVNPNNPDGRILPAQTLRAFAARHGPRAPAGLALVVDEAFADLDPAITLAGAPHTLVLRSFGKFYGLAGLRLGFAIGPHELIAALADALGPWAVSGPALQVGATALADTAWARAMRARLAAERAALDEALASADLPVSGGTDLFRLVETAEAPRWHAALAAEGIWTRPFDYAPRWLRIGQPGPALPRLRAALDAARARL
jgi:cobalamin biosynthetic protein CobC